MKKSSLKFLSQEAYLLIELVLNDKTSLGNFGSTNSFFLEQIWSLMVAESQNVFHFAQISKKKRFQITTLSIFLLVSFYTYFCDIF